VVLAALAVTAVLAHGGFSPSPGGTASAPASPAAPTCGVANPSGLQFATSSVPANPVTNLASVHVQNFVISGSQAYVLTGTALNVYSLTGSPVSSTSLPFNMGNANTDMVVGPDGDVYLFALVGNGFDLEKMTTGGSVLWAQPFSGVPRGMFAWHDGSGSFAVAVMIQGSSAGPLYSSTGSMVGSEPLAASTHDELIDSAPGGGLLATDSDYVYTTNAQGSITGTFGNATSALSASATPGAPFAFYQEGFATEVGSTIYVADAGDGNLGHGIDAFSPQGFYQGSANNNTLGGLSWNSPLQVSGSTIFFATNGGYELASMPIATLQALVAQPQQPTQYGFGDTLGIGAGLTTPVTAGYFAPGTTPSVTATFDPWWASLKSGLSMSYQVVNRVQDVTDAWPPATTVPVSSATVNSNGSLSLPVAIPGADQGPGVYLVNAQLASGGTTIGATCLTYSVGGSGDQLNFSTLDPGAGSGGPAPVRGVELAADFGTNLAREQLEWSNLLPNCNPGAVNVSNCGPSALSFSAYDPATESAALKAKALGVTFEVQLADGKPIDTAVVNYGNGLWQSDVQAIVNHFATSAPDLTAFEAWNEPNATFGSAANYVSQVLAPVHGAVAAVNTATGRHDLVVGGSVVGMDLGYWTAIAQAGGFADMDVAGIHPYTSYDRSFEEDGVISGVQQLQALMAQYGSGSKPIWITEDGFWSDGYASFYDVGNWVARAWILLHAAGVTNWGYFITEGEFNGPGTSYSLIQNTNEDDYVKPDGIALMTVAHALGGRPSLGAVNTRIPHAYAQLFGPAAGTSTDVLALWTDDVSIPADVTLSAGTGPATVPTTDVLGATGSLSVSTGVGTPLELSGAPIYLTVPAGDTLAVQGAESFGANLALTSAGATATATSATSGHPASDVIQGSAEGWSGGWVPSSTDTSPTVTVNLPNNPLIDRIVVSGSSIASVQPGLRSYTVQVDEGGTWTTVATETNAFFERMLLFGFSAVHASAIRVQVTAVDYSGQAGGLQPWFWNPSQGFPMTAPVYSVEAYAPGTGTPTRFTPTVDIGSSPSSPQVGDTDTLTATVVGPGGSPTPTGSVSWQLNGPAGTVSCTNANPGALTGSGSSAAAQCLIPLDQAGQYSVTASYGGDANFTAATGAGVVSTPKANVSVAVTPSNASPTTGGTETFTAAVTAPVGAPTPTGTIAWTVQAPSGPLACTNTGSSQLAGFGGTAWATCSVAVANAGTYDASAAYGGSGNYNAATGGAPVNAHVALPGQGYRLVGANGAVFPYGADHAYGSAAGLHLAKPIVGMAPTADGKGYWLVASDGGIFTYGDAHFHGSAGNIHLVKPVVGMAATPDGGGYWLVASDGGIFTYGDARFHGSAGSLRLVAPIVGMKPTPDGGGYWLAASDGGIFTYGDARFWGSEGGKPLSAGIVDVS
jgi:hypothetical protein